MSMNIGSQYPPITCRSLTKAFDGPPVVDDVSFEVQAGSITGFVGANGAGKSTTMRMILGLVGPTSGTALVNGVPYRQLEQLRRQVGAVLDGPGAHPGHTARAHLSILATAAGLPRGRVGEVLDLVGLGAHARRRVGAFSLGMRQRLALAGALLGDPPILLLDEPANGLDPPGMLWLRELLRGLAAGGRAVLVSSHLLGELAEVADRVLVIHRGQLVADAPIDELPGAAESVVELDCANPARAAEALRERGAAVRVDGRVLVVEGACTREVGEVAAAAGAGPVYRLSERAGSFEDAYFRLAGSLSGEHATVADQRRGSS